MLGRVFGLDAQHRSTILHKSSANFVPRGGRLPFTTFMETDRSVSLWKGTCPVMVS